MTTREEVKTLMHAALSGNRTARERLREAIASDATAVVDHMQAITSLRLMEQYPTPWEEYADAEEAA